MDEIGQDPKLNVRLPRGRWLDVAVAVALIAAAVLAVMTGRGSGPAAAPATGPGAAAAPTLLPSSVRARIPAPFGQPGGVTMLGSTAWISDWSASQIVGVDLAAGRVTRTVRVGYGQDEPVSMTAGGGSLWVLDFAGPLLRIDPASGAITKRPVRGLGADVAYGDGFIWVITDDPADGGGGQEYLYKIDPSRDVIVKAAPIPGAGTACAAFPGPRGIWIACAGVDRITLINQGSLKPVQSVPVHSGGYIPQIVPGQNGGVGAHPVRAGTGRSGHRQDHRHHPRRLRPQRPVSPGPHHGLGGAPVDHRLPADRRGPRHPDRISGCAHTGLDQRGGGRSGHLGRHRFHPHQAPGQNSHCDSAHVTKHALIPPMRSYAGDCPGDPNWIICAHSLPSSGASVGRTYSAGLEHVSSGRSSLQVLLVVTWRDRHDAAYVWVPLNRWGPCGWLSPSGSQPGPGGAR